MLDLQTPAFLVDRTVVERNCARMREKAARSGVQFRPHVKTHKVAEIGKLQHGGRSGPITVSTLAEAEHFAAAGFDDITYAVPIAPGKLDRIGAIVRMVRRLNILIDSEVTLQAVESFHRATGVVLDVFLKVDCGTHRAGVDPDAAASVRLAERISASDALRFAGLLTHAGHSYNARNADDIRAVALEETSALTRFRARLDGGERLVRSVGSTPTASVVDAFEDCEEVRPGNYVFYDAFQSTIGSCGIGDCAVSVLTTVVGSYPERGTAIVDAGALALSKDAGPNHVEPHVGFGVVCDEKLHPLPMRLVSLSQEHGKIATPVALTPGTKLRIIPNHSCLTAAMFDRYHVIEAGVVTGEWRPVRGW
ncbi:MAG: alanine racemase [Thermoanaerobaculia bacterium]